MSTVVDEKIVTMKFNNQQFESGVKTSMNTIDKLKKSLNFDDATKGLNELNKKANDVDFSVIQKGVEALTDRFSTWGIVGMRVIENLTDKFMGLVGKVTDFVSSGIIEGGIKRATNLENAHFTLQGLLKDETKVSAVMDNVNESVTGTAYGLDEAAVVASSLVASGLEAGDDLLSVLKAIAGVAAVTNSEYSDIGRIFTTIYGNGRIMGEQLIQLSTRGLNVAAAMAKYFNEVNSGVVQTSESTKQLIQDVFGLSTEITEFDVRSVISDPKTHITAELFSEIMSYDFSNQAEKANETVKGVVANIRSALARIGAGFVSPLIAQNNEVVGFLNALRVKINEVKKELVFDESINNTWALSKRFTDWVLKRAEELKISLLTQDWTKIGKIIANSIASLGNVCKAFYAIVKPIGQAMLDIFPPKTRDEMVAITQSIKDFTASLIISEETADKIRRTFAGLFAIIDIVKQAFVAIIKAIAPSTSVFQDVGGSILDFTAKIGDYIVEFDNFIKENDIFVESINAVKKAVGTVLDFIEAKFSDFANFMSPKLEVVRDLVVDIWDKLTKFGRAKFGKPDTKGIEEFADGMQSRLRPLNSLLNGLRTVFGAIIKALAWIGKKIAPYLIMIGDTLADGFTYIWNKLASLADFNTLIDLMNATTFLALLSKIYDVFHDLNKNLKGPAINRIKDIMWSVQNTLRVYQETLKAKVLVDIGKAILMLAASLVIMSMVDSGKLAAAMGVMTAGIADLMAAFKVVTSISAIGNTFQYLTIGVFFQEIASAILILSGAFAIMANLDMEGLSKGLAGMAGAVTVLVAALVNIGTVENRKKLVSAGICMTLCAEATKIAISAMKDASSMTYEGILKGIAGFGSALLLLTAAFSVLSIMDKKKMLIASESMILMATATKIAVSAMKDASSMKYEEILKGIAGFGSALLLLASAFAVTSIMDKKKMLIASESLILMATSTKIAVSAMTEAGSMEDNALLKGIATFGSALVLLVAAFLAVSAFDKSKMLLASTTMVLMATSIDILIPALKTLGKMNVRQIEQSVLGLAGVLALLVASMYAFTAMPSSAKLAASAASMLLLANAVLVLAPAMKILGSMKMSEVTTAIIALASAFLVLGVSALALSPIIPAVLGLAGAVAILGAGIALVGAGILALSTGLTVLGATGLVGLTALVTTLNVIIVAIPTLIRNMVVAMIEALTASVDAIAKLVIKIAENILDGLRSILPKIFKFLIQLGSGILDMLIEWAPKVVKLVVDIVVQLGNSLAEHAEDFATQIMNWLIGINNAIGKKTPELIDSMVDLACNLIVGFGKGLEDNAVKIRKALLSLLRSIWEMFKNFFGIHSPSKKMAEIGENLILGLIEGLASLGNALLKFLWDLGGQIIEWLIKGIKALPNTLLTVGKWVIEKLIEGIKLVFKLIFAVGGWIINKVIEGIKALPATLKNVGKWLIDRFIEGINFVWQKLKDIGGKIVGWISDGINALKDTVVNLGKAIGDWITGGAEGAADMGKMLQKIYDQVDDPEKKKQLKEKAKELGYEINEGTVEGVKDHATSVKSVIMALSGTMDDQRQQKILLDKAKALGIKIEDKTAEGIDSGKSLLEAMYERASSPEERAAIMEAAKKLGIDIETSVTNGVRSDKVEHILKTLYNMTNDPKKKEEILKVAYNLGIDMGTKTIEGFQGGLKGFAKVATDGVQGFLNGMSDADRLAALGGSHMAGAAVQGAKKTLQEHSPSKVMQKIGQYFGEGFAIGIEDENITAEEAAKSMADVAILNVAYALAKIQDMMNSEEMSQPTIVPVMDLSKVEDGMASINDMFNSDYVLKASSGIYDNQNGGNISNVNKTFNFTQNNYSPKSLSRIDIYRQTRNQFSALERMATL